MNQNTLNTLSAYLEQRAYPQQQDIRSEFTNIKGFWTHAKVMGHGPPLVIVPGIACASWMYVRLAQALEPFYTVYLYDPPGHGWSQGNEHYPISIVQLTDHLAQWLIQNGLARAALLGHSMGGEVTFDLAARYPHLVSKVVACAPTGIPEKPSTSMQALRLIQDLPYERFPLLFYGFRAYSVLGTTRLYKLLKNQSQHYTGSLLTHVHAPTLLIKGSLDVVIQAWTVEAIQQAIPNAVIREVRGAAHALTDSHPATVARYTRDFLTSHPMFDE